MFLPSWDKEGVYQLKVDWDLIELEIGHQLGADIRRPVAITSSVRKRSHTLKQSLAHLAESLRLTSSSSSKSSFTSPSVRTRASCAFISRLRLTKKPRTDLDANDGRFNLPHPGAGPNRLFCSFLQVFLSPLSLPANIKVCVNRTWT